MLLKWRPISSLSGNSRWLTSVSVLFLIQDLLGGLLLPIPSLLLLRQSKTRSLETIGIPIQEGEYLETGSLPLAVSWCALFFFTTLHMALLLLPFPTSLYFPVQVTRVSYETLTCSPSPSPGWLPTCIYSAS